MLQDLNSLIFMKKKRVINYFVEGIVSFTCVNDKKHSQVYM